MPKEHTDMLRKEYFPAFIKATRAAGYKVDEIVLNAISNEERWSLESQFRERYENFLEKKLGVPVISRADEDVNVSRRLGYSVSKRGRNFRALEKVHEKKAIKTFNLGLTDRPSDTLYLNIAGVSLASIDKINQDLYDPGKPQDYMIVVKEHGLIELQPSIRKLVNEMPQIAPVTA
jgi:hypothetical protein